MSQHFSSGICSRYGCIIGKRQSESLYHTRHRGCRTHNGTVTLTSTHTCLGHSKFFLKHQTGARGFTETPDIRSANIFTFVLSGKHRTARNHYCGNIYTASSHNQSRGSFIATTKQNHTIERIGSYRFFNIHTNKIPKKHGRWLHKGLTQRHYRKFKRKAASFIYTSLYRFGEISKMCVARSKFGPCITNSDYWLTFKFMGRISLILHPRSVNKSIFPLSAKPV